MVCVCVWGGGDMVWEVGEGNDIFHRIWDHFQRNFQLTNPTEKQGHSSPFLDPWE